MCSFFLSLSYVEKLVAKMVESDSEYEEEETLVLVELHGVIDSEIFAQDSFDKFKILAIESESPILQVENFVFTGEYDHTMGTAVIFEEEEKKVKKCDPVFCKKPTRMLKYVCKTNKKLNMKRVFVSEKSEGNAVKLKKERMEEGEREETMDFSAEEASGGLEPGSEQLDGDREYSGGFISKE